MKARLAFVAALVTGAAGTAEAQCSAGVASQACKASVDVVNFMTPQMATAIAAGSSTLGQSGVLGGLGRIAVSIRGTAVMNGSIPNITGFNTNGAAQNYTTDATPVPAAGVDASFGITKGWSLGVSRIGGIDLLVSALYLPDVDQGDISIKAKDGNTKFGYGVRVGIIDESPLTPGVHVSYIKRDLPTVSLSGSSTVAAGGSQATGSFALNDFSVKTTAWRVVAAKNLLIFGLQAGLGQDKYQSSSNIVATIPSQTVSGVTVPGQTATGIASMNMTRTNMFVGAMVNFFVFKLVVEAGQVSGGSVEPSFNSFNGSKDSAADSRTYLSGGLRIAF